MAGDKLGIHTGEMRAHAEHVAKVGERIGTAAGVAGNTTSHTEMYGLIGQFLVPAVLAVEGAGLAAIKGVETTTHGISGGIKDMAQAYDDNDLGIKDMLDKILGGK